MSSNEESKGYWKIDWGRQGGIAFAYIIVFFGYYGIIANILMFDKGNDWFSFVDISTNVKMMLFWTYRYYLVCYFLPNLLMFLICFWLTYKEDIPHYGIRASIWLVPFIILEGFLFYFIMMMITPSFGFSLEPFILQFGSVEGYINILILLAINLCGAFSGMRLKKYIKIKRKVNEIPKIVEV